MKHIFFLFISFTLIFCNTPKSEYTRIYNPQDQDSLLTNIMIYIYVNAPESTDSTKWLPRFRSFYEKNINRFEMQDYRIKDGLHYFFLIRPVGSSDKRRGVLGRFHLDPGSLMPRDFEEIVNTPHLSQEEVKERGQFLFNKLVEQGNLNQYMNMKHYIEWPDSTLVYDKKRNQWVAPDQMPH